LHRDGERDGGGPGGKALAPLRCAALNRKAVASVPKRMQLRRGCPRKVTKEKSHAPECSCKAKLGQTAVM